ncbi:MAG: homing endonuclease associated repeat-containing protein [Terriglobales bacterium]
MSDDAIHNPSPATNLETEITIEKIVEQTNVTEKPAEPTHETLPADDTSGKSTQTMAGESVQDMSNEPAQNTAAQSVPDTASESDQDTAGHESSYQTNQPIYQANQPVARRVPGRPTLKMSKEQLMAAIAEVTDKLGHVPSHAELMRTGKVSGRQIVKHFGTYTRALRACNLERSTGGKKLPLEKLFLDWARVVRELKKIPSRAEFAHMGKHSDTPLKSRFGSWGQVPRYLRRYMEEQGLTEEWKDVMELIRAYEQGQDGMEMAPTPECEQKKISTLKPGVMTDRPVYGPLIRPYPMIHGPINENGVLYLFGTVSDRLGFVVTLIQGAFPDCYAMRLVDVDRWQPVKIEFEYESRNFLRHLHDPKGCDIIVCWKHNWPECPLEVIELSKIVGQI